MKFFIYLMALLCLVTTAYAQNYKVNIGLTQPITPAATIETDGKILMSIDILHKLGINFSSVSKSNILLDDYKKKIILYNEFDLMLIDIVDLANALDVDYIRKNNEITIYNKIQSATVENGYVNVKFAFTSSYEYTIINNKLAIDLIGASFNPNAIANNDSSGMINNIRFGQLTLDAARCVFDLTNEVKNRPRKTGKGDHITLKLADLGISNVANIDDISLKRSNNNSTITLKNGASAKISSTVDINTGKVNIIVSNAKIPSDLQKSYSADGTKISVSGNQITTSLDVISDISSKVVDSDLIITISPINALNKDFKDLVITLDPGHGGNDPGARFGSIFEKNINYRATMFIKQALEEQGAKVIVTRNENNFLTLTERGQLAIDKKADFFISIHTNSTTAANAASGIETYYRDNFTSSQYLGANIHSRIVATAPIPNKGLKRDTSLYQSGLGVLRKASSGNVPCILIELGFINHYIDRSYLLDDNYFSKIADNIVKGIKDYLTGRPCNDK